VKKRRLKNIPEHIDKIFVHLKGLVLAAIVIVAILGIAVGHRYYRHTQDNPNYCATCHLMQDAFMEWQRGKHRDVVCQKCHALSMLEQNRILVAYIMKGEKPLAQTHGRDKPWKACKKCHLDEAAQGFITINKSFGHARHVFMQGIECKTCHDSGTHNFYPDEDACKKCHKDETVNGMKMKTFSCLKCHTF